MKTITLIAALLFLTACTGKSMSYDRSFRYSFSVDKIENSNLSAGDKAEELAKGAEQLLNSKGIDQAAKVAAEALKLDPKNFRAGFVQQLAVILLLQQGFVARVQPLIDRMGPVKPRWEKDVAKMRADPGHGLNSFYLEGKPEFTTEKQLQAHINTELQALENFRLFLKKNVDVQITMIASPLFVPDANARYAGACQINETADQSYELVCPPSATRHQISLNRADFEYIQDGLVIYELYLGLPNSYDLTGVVDSLTGLPDEPKGADIQKVADDLMTQAEFGTLKLPNTLAKGRGLVLDVVNSLTWAFDNQNLLCPKGQEDPTNRPGYYFNKGICWNAYLKPYLNLAQKVVITHGPVVMDLPGGDKHPRLNLFAPSESPMASIKKLGPFNFNECGNLTDLGDKTVGGLFPDGDGVKYLTKDNQCN